MILYCWNTLLHKINTWYNFWNYNHSISFPSFLLPNLPTNPSFFSFKFMTFFHFYYIHTQTHTCVIYPACIMLLKCIFLVLTIWHWTSNSCALHYFFVAYCTGLKTSWAFPSPLRHVYVLFLFRSCLGGLLVRLYGCNFYTVFSVNMYWEV